MGQFNSVFLATKLPLGSALGFGYPTMIEIATIMAKKSVHDLKCSLPLSGQWYGRGSMKLYKVGDKSKALCWKCEKLTNTTFKTRSVLLSSDRGLVDSVLVSVCDTCDETVGVPQQSIPRIKESIKPKRY